MEEIKDFTDRTSQEREFRIDDDLFRCAKALPAGVMRQVAHMAKMEPIDQFDAVGGILDAILLPDSAERFAERMLSPTNPISIEQLQAVVQWIMEEYGGRPTQQPLNSVPSPTVSGISSTAGVPPEVVNL